jgi:HK97 family phage prohead protease
MNKNTKEIRYYDFSKAENREYAPQLTEKDGRVVTGYAIVFNQRSRVLYDKTQRKYFTEVIDPRDVTKAFLDDQDIKFNFNHDNNMLLGRSLYGDGSLKFEVDEYGVKYTVELPNTTTGNDVLELVRRGDVFGCSFAFTYAKDGVRDEKVNGQNLRTVIKMDGIHDFSIVVDPAYWGTYVSTRAFELDEDNENEEAEDNDEMRDICPAEIEMALAEIDFI